MISASPQQKLLGEYIFQSVEDESEEKVVEKYSKEGKVYTLTVGNRVGYMSRGVSSQLAHAHAQCSSICHFQ